MIHKLNKNWVADLRRVVLGAQPGDTIEVPDQKAYITTLNVLIHQGKTGVGVVISTLKTEAV